MCECNPIATIIMLPVALVAYCWHHRNDPPFAQQWYRGCGWFPQRPWDWPDYEGCGIDTYRAVEKFRKRGDVHEVTGETNG